jgi:N-acetylmuramic acid 6-phosphate etherase
VRECVDLIQREDHEVHAAVERATRTIVAFIEAAEQGFIAGGRLVYLGAGTSGRLGVLDASEAPPTFNVEPDRVIGIIAGGDTSLRKSSEGREDDPEGAWVELAALELTKLDTVVGIAAGGTTPYVLGGVRIAKELGAGVTAILSCSPIAKPAGADHLIVADTGPEIVTGSTRMKAGTATKLVLNTISTTLMVRSGKVYENLMVDVRATNEKLRDRAARVISTLTGESRAAAFVALEAAGGSVKVAIVMRRFTIGREEAERRLAAVRGRLRELK